MNKYLPTEFSELNIDNQKIKLIESYLKNKKLFFLIYGNQLTGKTTLINMILDKYYSKEEKKSNVLYFNILKDQGINYFRNDLKNYCQINNNITNKKIKKTIVFDDMEMLSDQCQIIISTLINNYPNINFILSCNDLNKVNTSIMNILEKINLNPITNEYLLKIFNKITSKIDLTFNKEEVNFLINASNLSISKLINHINKALIIDNKYKLKDEVTNILIKDFDNYINLCKNSKYKEAFNFIINFYNNGFSVIDILDDLYIYIKIHSNLHDEKKFMLLKYICNYVNIFNNIHEHEIELIFLTNNIIILLNK